MRKTLLLLITLLTTSFAMAEDVIQVMPITTTAGVTYDEEAEEAEYLSVVLNNTLEYTGFQFELYLPTGITLAYYVDEDKTVFYNDMNIDRFPTIRQKVGKIYVDIPTHNLAIDDMGNGHYHITCFDEDLRKIKGNSGELFELFFNTSDDIKPGVYPIRVEGAVLGVSGNEGIEPANSVSFVTIKGKEAEETVPVNSLLDLGDNLIPSFVQEQLPANNVIINGVCENLVLTDGNDLSIPSNFTATNATYSRTMDTEWGTVCLPYAVQSNEQVAYYDITGVTDGVLTLEKYETLPANTPALMQKISGSDVTCSASNVDIVAGGDLNGTGSVTMHGSFVNDTKVTDANAYYIKNNKFWLNNEYFYINAFRAYFTYDAVGGAKPSQLNIGEISTAINALTSEEGVAGVYDANGVKKNSVSNGMNIIKMADGKCVKVFIK